MAEKFSLKDQLFNRSKVERIAREIEAVFPAFETETFIHEVLSEFPNLELKERMLHISNMLFKHLPQDFPSAVEVLVASLPEPCNPNLSDNDFGDFIYASYGEFVAKFGISRTQLDLSLNALEQFTTRFSMEYAIRPFFVAFPHETKAKMLEWTSHPHYHVRRLASEGSRPKLPWGKKIHLSTQDTLPVLEALYADETRFVARSVANHLNDIAKTDANLCIEMLQKWHQNSSKEAKHLPFITKHALRNLIKQGHPKALKIIGFEQKIAVSITKSFVSSFVKFNEHFAFEFEITASEDCKVLIDYLIQFKDKNGEISRAKVFKLKTLELKANEKYSIEKKHFMNPNMTTRKLYPGLQRFKLQINGNRVFEQNFELLPETNS